MEDGCNKGHAMSNVHNMIARIPFLDADPPGLASASEIATMDFAQTILDLPALAVFAWRETSQKPVEYRIHYHGRAERN